MTQPTATPDIERLLRELAPQALGAVARRFRDFAAAEDAVQEALLAAALQWSREGAPDNPRGWLIQVAVRRMTDHVRSESARRRREALAAADPDAGASAAWPLEEDGADDALTLAFMCCHPSLTPASSIALTLRAVGGLTTGEIARAFLAPEATMAQRISRAKQTIKASGVPFSQPSPGERAERLGAVLHVLYLIFNEGYLASAGPQAQRLDLSAEAIRLAREIHRVAGGEPEAGGLLALMLLTDARRNARTGRDGEMIPLDLQDRGLWDRDQIAEGVALLASTLAQGAIGPYQLQAAIAAVHAGAARYQDTDWPQILALYELLRRTTDNPMVLLNHAVATAMVRGAAAGLALLETLDGDSRLSGHHRLASVRAHLLEMAGDRAGAVAHYRLAAERTASLPERNYLVTQAARLSDGLEPRL